MTSREAARTLTEFVRASLRSDILDGEIKPGEPLRLEALMKRFEVSRSVIREVLISLTEENLVVSNPNRGFRVVTISTEGLQHLVDLRIQLESRALALSIEAGDMAWEANVVSAAHVLERTTQTTPFLWDRSPEWREAHLKLHIALTSACGNP